MYLYITSISKVQWPQTKSNAESKMVCLLLWLLKIRKLQDN